MIKFYNTASRRIETFKPILKTTVKMYTCGPTVYAPAHVGNLRSYLFADVLKRVLQYNGYTVKHVMNITDVGHLTSDADAGEDKIEKSARESRVSAWDIAKTYTDLFLRDTQQLHILPVTKLVKATDHIKQQIALIRVLEKKGFIYSTSDGIYFDTSKFPRYAKFARLDVKGLELGKRVEVGEKRNKTDFALWKLSPHGVQRDMEWPSPWGVGFPGWHIECSAMSREYLGQPFDIHTGGIDHISVHHSNEIAQSEAAYGKPLAHYWLHNEFLVLPHDATDDGRMGKSKHNTITLADVVARGIDPLAYRYLCLTVHYRKKLEFSWEALEAAASGLAHLRTLVSRNAHHETLTTHDKKIQKEFGKALSNDLDTPRALALLWDACKKTFAKELVEQCDRVVGLDLFRTPDVGAIPERVLILVEQRERHRQQKEWMQADAVRTQIAQLGYSVDDTPKGPRITKI